MRSTEGQLRSESAGPCEVIALDSMATGRMSSKLKQVQKRLSIGISIHMLKYRAQSF